jgi:hypothetical protein
MATDLDSIIEVINQLQHRIEELNISELISEVKQMKLAIKQINIKKTENGPSSKIIVKKTPKEVTIRVGLDLLFTYPIEMEGYDRIKSFEILPTGIKIVETSKELGTERTHFVQKADFISWI